MLFIRWSPCSFVLSEHPELFIFSEGLNQAFTPNKNFCFRQLLSLSCSLLHKHTRTDTHTHNTLSHTHTHSHSLLSRFLFLHCIQHPLSESISSSFIIHTSLLPHTLPCTHAHPHPHMLARTHTH